MSTSNHHVIHEDDTIKVIRRRSKGRDNPGGFTIEFKDDKGAPTRRSLICSIDELFDLTEVLDDICDNIEDNS